MVGIASMFEVPEPVPPVAEARLVTEQDRTAVPDAPEVKVTVVVPDTAVMVPPVIDQL